MPKNYDSIDLDFTWDGDLILDENQDLKDTSYNLLASIQNEIFSTIKSDIKDWREDPSIGADLGDFVGEPNTSVTGKAIQDRIKSSLSYLVSPNDLAVRVVPVGVNRVMVTLTLQVIATPENGLRAGETINVSFLYDYFERGVFVPLSDMNKFGGRTS